MTRVSPLNHTMKMVNDKGEPTPEFMRWWQEFTSIVNPLATPEGVSDVFDVIGETRGAIMVRGEEGWALLAPGTAGRVLISQGPGSDPTYSDIAFLNLSDTPSDYSGAAGFGVKVNDDADGLEFYEITSGGAELFTDLTDVPGDYTGNAGLVVAVNGTEDGLQFITAPADGADGVDGSDGADGVGVPSGGTAGQVLKKASGTDYDTEWANESGGGGGATDFTDLGDVPASYTGEAGKAVVVNGDEDGLEFVTASGGSTGPYAAFRYLRSANVVVSSGVQKLPFDTLEYAENMSGFDTGTGIWTVPSDMDGKWATVMAGLRITGSTSLTLYIRVDGSVHADQAIGTSDIQVHDIVKLEDGMEIQIDKFSGGNITMNAQDRTFFAVIVH